MKKVFLSLVIVICLGMIAVSAEALVVTLETISSGSYEDGKFTPRNDYFKARYVIDEEKREITISKILENNREGKIEEGESYEITNIAVSEGPSALLFSRSKKGQKIFTAVREAGLGDSETIIIGKDFYEFCRAANGKFYLEYGKVSTDN